MADPDRPHPDRRSPRRPDPDLRGPLGRRSVAASPRARGRGPIRKRRAQRVLPHRGSLPFPPGDKGPARRCAPARQPGVAAGRRARRALAGPPEPPGRLGLRTTRGSRPRAHRSGARRHRRNADPGHQAIRGRVPAGRLGAVTCLDARADGPLLLTPGRAPRMRPERAKGARRHPRERLSRTRTPLRSTSSLPIMSERPAEIFRGITATEWPVIVLFLCGLLPRSLTVLGELMISRVVAVACRGVQRRGLAAADPGARSAGSGLSAVGGGDDPAGRDEFEQVGDVARVAAGELGDLSQPVAY